MRRTAPRWCLSPERQGLVKTGEFFPANNLDFASGLLLLSGGGHFQSASHQGPLSVLPDSTWPGKNRGIFPRRKACNLCLACCFFQVAGTSKVQATNDRAGSTVQSSHRQPYEYRCLYFPGVVPKLFLNAVEKCWAYL